MSFSFDKRAFDKNVNKVLTFYSLEIVPNSKCSKRDIIDFDENLLAVEDFCYFLITYGAIREKNGAFSTLSLKGSENIISFTSELKGYYTVPDNIIPFYYVGSNSLCFDRKKQYGQYGCIAAWNHEADKPVAPDDGIKLFLNDRVSDFRIQSFSDFIEIVSSHGDFPGIEI
jgi:hypothetical protein